MARFVIDPPTLLRLVDEEVVVHPAHQLVAPNSIRSDAMQLLLADVRQGQRTAKDALATHDRLTGVKIRLLGDRVSRAVAWQIALEQGWETLRDAEYTAITRLQADAFVTIDAGLAAKVATVVRVAPLEALCTG
jgi:predicted nucleic acid-binding protein